MNFALILDSDTTLEFELVPKSDYTGDVTAYLDGGNVPASVLKVGKYIVSVPGISAHQLGDKHTIHVVTEGDSFDVEASALSYVRGGINSSINGMKEAVTSLYRYYDATMTQRT